MSKFEVTIELTPQEQRFVEEMAAEMTIDNGYVPSNEDMERELIRRAMRKSGQNE